ncbi:MAG: prephenate dehydratase [Deltaproteobacteria bacterium]|nr:prephenate dehydratase [Deltaproteobacteria bacterium]
MRLKEIRKNIDNLDFQVMQLLNNRMEQVLLAKKFKSDIEDTEREKEVLDRIEGNCTRLIRAEFMEKIYIEIIKESKRLQQNDFHLIAFQGDHGAYGEMASTEWNRDLVPFPCNTFAEVFEGIHSGLYEYGIVPVENTLGGAVADVNHLLIKTDLNVVGAVELPVHHCLLALPGTDHREIRSIYSHPQALSQCRQFLQRNKLEPVPFTDTAGAAKMLAEKTPKRSAAIASKLSAKLYNLEIIKEKIEDMDRNMTRFLVLSKKENTEEGNKCSVVFATEHKAGTLFSVLHVFAGKDINLTRIESIPNEPGDYAFFLDFEGSDKDDTVVQALTEIREITTDLKLLGCYKERKVS